MSGGGMGKGADGADILPETIRTEVGAPNKDGSSRLRTTNIRFNLDKELQRRAWEYLQTMDKREFKSYSHAIAVSVVDYFDRYYRSRDDPYLETRERETEFIARIVGAVEQSLSQSLPVFLAGWVTGMTQGTPVGRAVGDNPVMAQETTSPTESISVLDQSEPSEGDIDWDFLGE